MKNFTNYVVMAIVVVMVSFTYVGASTVVDGVVIDEWCLYGPNDIEEVEATIKRDHAVKYGSHTVDGVVMDSWCLYGPNDIEEVEATIKRDHAVKFGSFKVDGVTMDGKYNYGPHSL